MKRQGRNRIVTDRELEIIIEGMDGKTYKEIGDALGISARTVEHHFLNIFNKLGVKNRIELAHEAVRLGLVAVEAPSIDEDEEYANQSCWGQFVKGKLKEKRENEAWLARRVSTEESLIQARIRGKCVPSSEPELGRIAEALGLEGDEVEKFYAAAVVDIHIRSVRKLRPSIKERELEVYTAAALRIAVDLFKATRQLRSIYWLPFIMQGLGPLRFHSGKLAMDRDWAINTTIPPFPSSFIVGPVSRVENYSFNSRYTSSLINFKADPQQWVQNAEISLKQILELRREIAPRSGQFLLCDDGRTDYIIDTNCSALLFECPPRKPVLSLSKGIVSRVRDWQDHSIDSIAGVSSIPRGKSQIVDVNCLNGYEVCYNGLQNPRVNEGQIVNKGDLLGFTGQHIMLNYYPQKNQYEWVSGLSVHCGLTQDGYPVQILGEHPIDPSVLTRFAVERELSIPGEHIATTYWQLQQRHEQLQTLHMSDIIYTPSEHLQILAWRHYLDEPYVMLPHGHISEGIASAGLAVASTALFMYRMLKQKMNR